MDVVVAGEPYLGPRSYGIGDQCGFYGRDRECREVSALWQGNRLLVLYGPSGVGKTSLVQAGVISRFGRQAVDVLPVGRVSVSDSSAFYTASPVTPNPYDFALLSAWSPDESSADLAGMSLTQFLGRHNRTDRYDDPLPVLAVIDQFEELFIDFRHRQRCIEEFIDHLADAVKNVPSLRLLVAIREEALANLIPRENRLAGHSRARFLLLPLTRDAARDAVIKPLVGTGRSFASGVAEKLVDDLRTTEVINHVGRTRMTAEFVEPMRLQVVCYALWRALPNLMEVIIEDDLHRYADIGLTVAEFCGEMVAEVAAEYRIPASELDDWLERTFITELGARAAAYEGLNVAGGMWNSIARALETQHILKSERRAGTLWYELQHDLLVEPIRRLAAERRPGRQQEPGDKTVVTVDPANYLRAAEDALASGDVALSKKHAQAALHASDDRDRHLSARAHAEKFLGDIASQERRLWEAEGWYRRAAEHFETLQEQPAVGQLLTAIGQLLLKRGSYADAVETLQSAVSRPSSDPAIEEELAKALWASGQVPAATALLDTISAIAPDPAEVLISQLRAELADPASVIDDLDHLLALRPESGQRADVRAARALALARLGRISEAVIEASAAEREAPGSGPVLVRVSGVACVAGDPSQADLLVRRASDSRNPSLLARQREEIQRLLAEPLGGDSGS